MTKPADQTMQETERNELEAVSSMEPPSGAAQAPDPVEELRARIASLEDALLRAKADYQNLQRRAAAERLDAVRYANADLMKSLLGVVDGLQDSLAAARSGTDVAALATGVRLVYENFMKALNEFGLETIDALHKPFDPVVHEALMRQPSNEHPAGAVLEEAAKGYRLRERVLRPAKVVVAMKPAENPSANHGAKTDDVNHQ